MSCFMSHVPCLNPRRLLLYLLQPIYREPTQHRHLVWLKVMVAHGIHGIPKTSYQGISRKFKDILVKCCQLVVGLLMCRGAGMCWVIDFWQGIILQKNIEI